MWEELGMLRAEVSELSSLSGQIAHAQMALEQRHQELCVQHQALCECLCRSGVLTSAELLASLRKVRCARALTELLGKSVFLHGVALCSGISAVRCAYAASKGCLRSVTGAIITGVSESVCRGSTDAKALYVSKPLFTHLADWMHDSLRSLAAPSEPLPKLGPPSPAERSRAPAQREIEVLALAARTLEGRLAERVALVSEAVTRLEAEQGRAPAQPELEASLPDLWLLPLPAGSLLSCLDGVSPPRLRACCRELREALHGASAAGAADTGAARAADVNARTPLAAGQLVALHGLQTERRLNGRTGRLVYYSEEAGRWSLVLSSGQRLRVRPRHLQALAEPDSPRRQLLEQSSTKGLLEAWRRIAEGFADPVSTVNLAQASHTIYQATVSQPHFYVSGGYDGHQPICSVEQFYIATGKWYKLPDMQQGRDSAACGVLGRHLYICGGSNAAGSTALVERFDAAARAWQVMPQLHHRRSFASAAAMDGILYVVGGGATSAAPLSSVESFDPREGVWRQLPRMLEARFLPATVAINHCLYVCCGANMCTLRSMECYDPLQRKWSTLMPLKEGRFFLSSALVGQRYYVCGGCGHSKLSAISGHAALGSAERFDARTGRWEPLASMLVPRCGAAAVFSPTSGRLIVCGGCPYSAGESMASVESFNPATGLWQALQPMKHRRAFASVVVSMGHLYLCGGSVDGVISRKVERLDLATQEWEEVAPMRLHRIGASGASTSEAAEAEPPRRQEEESVNFPSDLAGC